jgi:uncharacterized protein YcsI (UPF0317 family)
VYTGSRVIWIVVSPRTAAFEYALEAAPIYGVFPTLNGPPVGMRAQGKFGVSREPDTQAIKVRDRSVETYFTGTIVPEGK